MAGTLEPGAVRLRGVSRRFRILHDRSLTLKETLIRRKRTDYTELWALRDVDLDIAPGEAVGIIGRNGSGKSTLLKLLAGIIPAQTGTIETGGSVAAMLELGSGFHPDFTGRENVFMNGSIYGLTERQVKERLDAIIDFAEVADFIDMPVRTYSSGMQMRLAFAVASHVDPDILLLDEVLAVGDEAFQRKCMGRMHAFRERGGTLVFVSHDPGAVEQVCDRAVLVDDGRLVQDGVPQDTVESYHRILAARSSRTGPEQTPRARGADEGPPQQLIDLTDVALVDGNRTVESIVSGDPLTVRVRGYASRPIANPDVAFSLSSVDGTLCFATSTSLERVTLGSLKGHFVLEVAFAAVAIHEGRFDVSVAVRSSDRSTEFASLSHVCPFDVFAARPGSGMVALRPTWHASARVEASRVGSPASGR